MRLFRNLAYFAWVSVMVSYVWTWIPEADLVKVGSTLPLLAGSLVFITLVWAFQVYHNQLGVRDTKGMNATEHSKLCRLIQLKQRGLGAIICVGIFALILCMVSPLAAENPTWGPRVIFASCASLVFTLACMPYLFGMTKEVSDFRNSLLKRTEVRTQQAAKAQQMREEGKEGFGQDSKLDRYNKVVQQG